MNELVFTRRNEAVTDSLTVAEYFQKRHDRVLRAIENLLEGLPKNGVSYFIKSSYTDASGKGNLMYLMNRDGFSLLAMGFTGKKALQWKLKYIEAFNQMEKALLERQSEQWLETRKTGMLARKSETDGIKKLVELAKEQGSTHSDMLYMTYTRLVNKLVGVKSRNSANIRQLKDLETLERIILNTIEEKLQTGADYHEIYKECKRKCEVVSEYAKLGDYSMLRPLPA